MKIFCTCTILKRCKRNMASRFSGVELQKKEVTEETKSNNVKVVVRVRPPNDKELMCGKTNVIKVVDDFMLTFDPKEEDINSFSSSKTRMSILDKRIRDLHFAFDRVFNNKATNAEVFTHTTKDILDSILEGYNCSVFAYGATSAGKTHTMLGSQEEPGVIFLTMMELYAKLMAKDDEFNTDISVSYLEIYNETCKDLLLPTGPLAVREDPDKGVCVNGLSLHKPRSAEELLEMLHFGNQNRTQHPTDANKQSSRSHAVFQVFVRQCPKDSGLSASVKVAKISLIDLAGSERATVTTNRGDRLREGANINKSLLALGNCINALAENKENLHVPYRNSKLTRLLKDSLGGNCKTIMIAAVSPSSLSYEDTYNTLKYANRAKNIKSTLSVNTVNVDYHVSQYAKIVKDLKEQLSNLQSKIDKFENGSLTPQRKEEERQTQIQILKRYEKDLQCLYKEKVLIKQQLIDCEASEKELMVKFALKERSFKLCGSLQLLTTSHCEDVGEDESSKRIEQVRASNALKLSKLQERRTMLMSSIEEINTRLVSLQNEIDQWANKADSGIRMQLNMMYDLQLLTAENVSLKAQQKHIRKYLKMQESESKKSDKVASNLIQIIEAQQRKIEGLTNGLPHGDTMDISQKIDDLPKSLLNGPKISWADQSSTEGDTTQYTINLGHFSSCTPFKTPSRKPDVFRQLVMESRQKHSDRTERNTAVNTGPVRSKLLFTDKEDISTHENGSINVTMSKDDSEKVSDEEYMLESPRVKKKAHFDSYLVEEAPAKINKTFSISQQCKFHEDTMEILLPLTPVEESRSNIPIRTPLKSFNERLPTVNNNRRRMRSFTEGNSTFVVGNETINVTKERHLLDSTFCVSKVPGFANGRVTSKLKRKKIKLGLPCRATSTTDLRKENVRPQNGTSHDLDFRPRGLKASQSFAKKTVNRERFRF